jgi:hypothetical protein
MTKSANIRKRRQQRTRGRPRDEDCERTESGRKSRARAPQEDPRKTALEARQRVYGVSADDAGQPEAGSVLGRLYLAQAIDEAMFEAGKRYLALHTNALRALDGPASLAKGGNGGCGGDVISDDWVAWAFAVTSHYRVMRAALAHIGVVDTVESIAVYDMEPLPAMLPLLDDGLSLLVQKFGILRSKAA